MIMLLRNNRASSFCPGQAGSLAPLVSCVCILAYLCSRHYVRSGGLASSCLAHPWLCACVCRTSVIKSSSCILVFPWLRLGFGVRSFPRRGHASRPWALLRVCLEQALPWLRLWPLGPSHRAGVVPLRARCTRCLGTAAATPQHCPSIGAWRRILLCVSVGSWLRLGLSGLHDCHHRHCGCTPRGLSAPLRAPSSLFGNGSGSVGPLVAAASCLAYLPSLAHSCLALRARAGVPALSLVVTIRAMLVPSCVPGAAPGAIAWAVPVTVTAVAAGALQPRAWQISIGLPALAVRFGTLTGTARAAGA